MKRKGITCAKCGRTAPTRTLKYLRGAPLGPACYEVIKKREKLRASGNNKRVMKSPETGLTHSVSDFGDVCPSEKDHCLQCECLRMRVCPLELKSMEAATVRKK
jgi:hypothetical protein